MILIVFTFKATQKEKEVAQNCIALLETAYKLYDLSSYKPDNILEPDTHVVVFGFSTKTLIDQYLEQKKINLNIYELPTIRDLIDLPENRDTRLETYNTLLKWKSIFKQQINLPNVITKNDLPDIDKYQSILLAKMLEENINTSYTCMNKNNQVVEVGNKQLNKQADIFISIEELYTIRSIMDTLGIEEVQVHKEGEEKK